MAHIKIPMDNDTRWNSLYTLIEACIKYREPIDTLTELSKYPYKALHLDGDEWMAIQSLRNVLRLFKEATDFFQKLEVPTLADTLPSFDLIRSHLLEAKTDSTTHPVVKHACVKGITLLSKYQELFDKTAIYYINLVLHPSLKLHYFRQRFHGSREAEKRVRDTWTADYRPKDSAATDSTSAKPSNPFEQMHKIASLGDELDDYLLMPPENVGETGVVMYWDKILRRKYPQLAKMALDYFTAPASSVDIERAFSRGRLTVTHLRHQLGTDSFKALMLLSSWINEGVVTDEQLTAALEESMARSGDGADSKKRKRAEAAEADSTAKRASIQID
jgi:hypothetical protein